MKRCSSSAETPCARHLPAQPVRLLRQQHRAPGARRRQRRRHPAHAAADDQHLALRLAVRRLRRSAGHDAELLDVQDLGRRSGIGVSLQQPGPDRARSREGSPGCRFAAGPPTLRNAIAPAARRARAAAPGRAARRRRRNGRPRRPAAAPSSIATPHARPVISEAAMPARCGISSWARITFDRDAAAPGCRRPAPARPGSSIPEAGTPAAAADRQQEAPEHHRLGAPAGPRDARPAARPLRWRAGTQRPPTPSLSADPIPGKLWPTR